MQFEWSKRESSICHSWIWCGIQHTLMRFMQHWGWGFVAEVYKTIVLTGDKDLGHLVACTGSPRIRFKDDCESFREINAIDKLEPLTGICARWMFTNWNEEEISTLSSIMRWSKNYLRIFCGKTWLQLGNCTTGFTTVNTSNSIRKSSRWGGSMSEVTILLSHQICTELLSFHVDANAYEWAQSPAWRRQKV